jgi:predicted transport protein
MHNIYPIKYILIYMIIYYAEYIVYQVYSNILIVTVRAPQTMRLKNKSKVESDELTSPQLQRRDVAYVLTGVEIDKYHIQMTVVRTACMMQRLAVAVHVAS